MRIVLLDLGLQFRNRQANVLALARHLCMLPGTEALVACPKKGELAARLSEMGLPLLTLPGRGWGNPALLVALCHGLRRFQPDLVHAFGGRAARAAGFGLSFMENLSPRIVVSQDTLPMAEPGPPFNHPRHFPCDDPKMLAAILCPTHERAKKLASVGFPQALLRVLLPGLPMDNEAPRVPRPNGRFIFLASALWHPKNDLTTLIDAMDYLHGRDDVPPWEARVIGEGDAFGYLLTRAKQKKVESHLSLLGEQSARELLPLCDAAIVTNTAPDEHNLFHLQAWRAGRPVICPTLPGPRELAGDERSVLFFVPGNAAALASAMLRCMIDQNLYRRLQSLGRQQFLRHTLDAVSRATVDVYEELLNKAPLAD